MIFFNIDNTLVDTTFAETVAAADLFKQNPGLANHYKEEAFPGIWNEAVEKYNLLYAAGQLGLEEQKREMLREIFRETLDDADADRIYASFLKVCEENWKLFPDVITVLEKLKDVPKGIVSNGDGQVQMKKLSNTGIDKYFDHVFVSGDVGFRKPDPAFFKHACKKSGKHESSCYHVGCRVDLDAKAAKDAGLLGIWLNRKMVEGKKEKVAEIITLLDFNYIEF